MPLLTLTASDRYHAGKMADALRRVLHAYGHAANELDEADAGPDTDEDWAAAGVEAHTLIADTRDDRSELVLLLHALEDAERAAPVARPAANCPAMVEELSRLVARVPVARTVTMTAGAVIKENVMVVRGADGLAYPAAKPEAA